MIENFGIGIDIVDIEKFEKISYLKKPSFYKKLFLPSEIKYCLKYKNSAEHFAGKFAIKEALKKSIKEPISFLDIETYHSKSKLKIKLLKDWNKKYKVLGSISHDNKYAIGFVISEKLSNIT
ncbi:MAG: holo-ACP synthase [Nitrosopumilus sp.]|nr:holo-ACP synthase [Nitrosopumilus sp.]MCV0366627.1 holo-ACP synthase [Nitrosopumilus sp.]MCV0410550.1 holo-ACP synthase [Nitrosopumilus sp.]